MRKVLLISTLFSFILIFCAAGLGKKKPSSIFLIETTKGNIKIKLYEDTPDHFNNFNKLASENYYDSILFHRVIKGFMIQTGDPDSKAANKNQILGVGGPGYTIPAEILPHYFHKKGALAAARRGDQVNPKQESSGSQFYIIQGTVFDDEKLNKMEEQKNQYTKQTLMQTHVLKPENIKLKNRLDSLRNAKDIGGFALAIKEVEAIIESEFKPFAFSPEQREAYSGHGGSPHLDGQYTVFGEVLEGLNIIDSIAAMQTIKDKPIEDIRIISVKPLKK